MACTKSEQCPECAGDGEIEFCTVCDEQIDDCDCDGMPPTTTESCTGCDGTGVIEEEVQTMLALPHRIAAISERTADLALAGFRRQVTTACRIGDESRRRKDLRTIATNLVCYPWPAGDCRDAALNLACAIDDATIRVGRTADLAALVRGC